MKQSPTSERLFRCIPAEGTRRHADLLEFCKQNQSHVLASLPFIASEVAEYCGFYAFFELIREFGGSKINIAGGPEKLFERYGLSLSDKDYQKILFHIESDWIDLPSAWGVFVALRRAAIMGEVQGFEAVSGTPLLNRSLAQKYGVSERYVRKLSRACRGPRPQGNSSKAHGNNVP